MAEQHRSNDSSADRRAAQYVRMSTDHQRYSTIHQMAALADYADRSGLRIVRTYADEGRSGLSLGGRDALQRLIQDVTAQRADFAWILVYDVSRWGRFQDVDEAAFLEHLCKRAGIRVHYCEEPFSNDGSLASSIVKTLKRAMAGEYSRELSTKVFAGQRRLCGLGYHQGGAAGLGLRRRLIDAQGQAKGDLRPGELKSVQSDRVILVPGPAEEVATVQRIFRWFVEDRWNERRIAARLNQDGIHTDLGRAWTFDTVRSLLANEKYIGNNVYNRASCKLGQRRRRNPPADIIRLEGAFEALVDRALFDAAQQRFAQRKRRFSNAELLEQLARLRLRSGRVSSSLIDAAPDMASRLVFERRFGGLLRAYQQIGFQPGFHVDTLGDRSSRRQLTRAIADTLGRELARVGGCLAFDPVRRLHVCNGEITLNLYVAFPSETADGQLQWRVGLRREPAPDFTLVIRMAAGRKTIQDYISLPSDAIGRPYLILKAGNGFPIDQFRHTELKRCLTLFSRQSIAVVP